MAHPISPREPEREEVELPVSLEGLAGPCVKGSAEVLAKKDGRGLACLTFSERKLSWIEDFQHFEFEVQPSGKLKAVRTVSEAEMKHWRVPLWIQGAEVPMCCGGEMVFVGQIDDDRLCTEVPPDAKMWWHDVASFYVFTCPKCLEVTAVGQQF